MDFTQNDKIGPFQRHLEKPKKSTQINTNILGQIGHGKTTLTAAIARVLAQANQAETYATIEQLENATIERTRGTSISCSDITYIHNERQYLHADYPTHADILKSMITGLRPIDGAILVISAQDGPTPQTREQVLAAHQVGVPDVVVFLNKVDLQEDPELLDLVELEVRELFARHHFPCAETPIIRGSALQALESQGDLSRTDPAAQCIWALLDAMQIFMPTTIHAIDKSFQMPIEDIFVIKQRGLVAGGRITSGKVRVGDSVEIVGMQNETRTATINYIDTGFSRLPPKQAEAGDNAGLFLSDVQRNEIGRGQVLATPGSINAHTHFKAHIYVLAKEEGGRHTPFFNRYRPSFYMRTTDITGQFTLPDNVEKVLPGESVEATVQLIIPVALEKGTRFAVREGGRTTCVGICTEIIK